MATVSGSSVPLASAGGRAAGANKTQLGGGVPLATAGGSASGWNKTPLGAAVLLATAGGSASGWQKEASGTGLSEVSMQSGGNFAGKAGSGASSGGGTPGAPVRQFNQGLGS